MKGASRKTAFILFFVRFIKLLVSVVTLSVSARLFGVGMDRERWILCLNFVTVLNLAIWGPLNETFRAKFIFVKEAEGEAVALKRTSSLLFFTLLILCGVIVMLEVFSLPVSKIIAPAYDTASLLKLSIMLRWLLAAAIITQATQLLSSILNAYHSFYVPEITGFFSGMLNLVLILVLNRYIGIYSFVVASYVSLLILLLALMYQVRKLNIPLFKGPLSISWNDVKPFILFSVPFFIPYIIGQCNGLIEKSISNLLGHSAVATIDYSKKITDIVYTVLTSVLVTIMVPVLSAKFSKENIESVMDEAGKYLQMILLMLALILPVLIVCAGPISAILYNKGNISQETIAQIARLIQLYSVSLVAMMLYLVFGVLLLSINKSRQYAFYGMIAQLLMIGVNFLVYKRFGIYTFVFTVTIAHFTSAGLMFRILPVRKKAMAVSVLKYSTVIVLTTLFAMGINRYVVHITNNFVHVIVNSFAVLILVSFLAVVFRFSEVQIVREYVLSIRKKINPGT